MRLLEGGVLVKYKSAANSVYVLTVRILHGFY